MPITGGGSLGAPGTRITKNETETSETKAQITEALVFAIAGDLICLCLLVIVALGGWVSVVPGVIIIALLLIWFLLWFFRVPKFFVFSLPWVTIEWHPLRIHYAPLTFAATHEIALKMTGILAVAAGLVYGEPIWQWLTVYGALGQLVQDLIRLFFLPWYVYVGAGVGLVLFALAGQWKFGVTALSLVSAAYGIYAAANSMAITASWDALIARARYIAIPFVLPWVIGAILIMLVQAKNLMFPYLDFNLRPVGFDEVREVGLAGLWLPKLLSKAPQEPTPDRFIKIEVSERNGKTRAYIDLPNTSEFVEFCKSVYHGESFALRAARAVGLSRKEFEKIRDAFIQRGWACWVNKGSRNQGVDLLVAGKRVVENIALDRTVG